MAAGLLVRVAVMRRNLLVLAIVLVGCTRPNPAFDSESDSRASDEVADGTELSEAEGESGEAEGESDEAESSSTQSGDTDLPAAPCEFQPSAGLALGFGDPIHFGGSCPNGVGVWAEVIESSGGMAIVETCGAAGCESCSGGQPLSIAPLLLGDHLPVEPSTCLRIEASVPLGPVGDVCQWGALSLYSGNDGTPYVIAIAQGSEPTMMGLATLTGVIPVPIKVATCDCADIGQVGQVDDCCDQAASPPEFYGYPFGNTLVLPGEELMISLPNQAEADYYFRLFQAERLNTCQGPERALSWAVTAKLP
jgi:hypothetical protein